MASATNYWLAAGAGAMEGMFGIEGIDPGVGMLGIADIPLAPFCWKAAFAWVTELPICLQSAATVVLCVHAKSDSDIDFPFSDMVPCLPKVSAALAAVVSLPAGAAGSLAMEDFCAATAV
jgi:hypothetical protein